MADCPHLRTPALLPGLSGSPFLVKAVSFSGVTDMEAPKRTGAADPDDEELAEVRDRLSPDQHEVIIVRFMAGSGISEIAGIVGMKPGTVEALQRRGSLIRGRGYRLGPGEGKKGDIRKNHRRQIVGIALGAVQGMIGACRVLIVSRSGYSLW